MGNIKEFKYKKIENFLTKEQISLMSHYCKLKHIVNKDSFDFVQSNVGDTRFYADPLMEALMLDKRKLLEQDPIITVTLISQGCLSLCLFKLPSLVYILQKE